MKLIHINKHIIVLLVFLVLLNIVSYSQNTISISNSNMLSLEFASPYNPGSKVSDISNNYKWLNYSIVHTLPEPAFSISVEISSGTIPDGMELRLVAGACTSSGGGQPGTPTGVITLSNQPQTLISNIGTCSTGTGINVGHQLTYSFVITNFSQLSATSAPINLLFTIIQ